MKDSSSVWNYSNTVPKVDLTNPDEMIRANGAAEAAQTDRLKAEESPLQIPNLLRARAGMLAGAAERAGDLFRRRS